MGREFELKYQADAAVLAAVERRFGGFSETAMETSYFDTVEGDFSERKWMLRRRMENGRSVCTLKIPLPDGSRGEWETDCETIEDGLEKLCKLDGPLEVRQLAQKELVQTCGARFIRLARELTLEGCTVEIALDQGYFLGGGQEVPFSELEVELKDGSETAAVAFAECLAREYGLEPEKKSKVQRAMALRL